MSIEWMVYRTQSNGFVLLNMFIFLHSFFTIFFLCCPLQTSSRVLCTAPICKGPHTTETDTSENNDCFWDLCYCLWWGLEALNKPSGLMTLLTKHFNRWMIWTQLLLIIREEWSSVKNKENLVDLKSSFPQIWFTKNLLRWTLLYNLPKQNYVQGH